MTTLSAGATTKLAKLEAKLAQATITEAEAYKLAHLRCRMHWGAARQHVCWMCGGPAAHWAYNHKGEHPKYSLDPQFYLPMCVRCHTQFDGRRRAREKAAPKRAQRKPRPQKCQPITDREWAIYRQGFADGKKSGVC